MTIHGFIFFIFMRFQWKCIKQECIPEGCLPPTLVAVWWVGVGGCLPGCLPRVSTPIACWDTHSPSIWTEWQTGVKTLPCPTLHLKAVIIGWRPIRVGTMPGLGNHWSFSHSWYQTDGVIVYLKIPKNVIVKQKDLYIFN